MVVRRAMPVITAAVHSVEAPSKHHLWESDECRSTRDAFQHCENFEIVARFDIVARILREREREIRDYLGALLAEARNCSASERSQDRRVPLCRDFARGCSAVNHGREFTARTRAITIANCRSTVIKTANRTIRAYYDWRWTRIASARCCSTVKRCCTPDFARFESNLSYFARYVCPSSSIPFSIFRSFLFLPSFRPYGRSLARAQYGYKDPLGVFTCAETIERERERKKISWKKIIHRRAI